MDRLLAGQFAPDAPGAAVLVARGDEVLFSGGYGLANLEHGVEVTPRTVFSLASLGKLLTATAVLLLADEKKIDLDAEIQRYLPDYPARGGRITVADLLAHTSGIPDYLSRPDVMKWVRSDHTPGEVIDTFKDKPPDFAAGERAAYSNSNYILLGAIIERVSGQTYEEFVRDRVLEPAGMSQTRYGGYREIIPHRAAGYEPTGDGRVLNVRFYSISAIYAAGGHLSTVGDLHRWYRAIDAGDLLRDETLRLYMTRVKLNDGEEVDGGLGCTIRRHRGRLAVMKGGELPGFNSFVLILPEEKLFVAILTNLTRREPGTGNLAHRLADIVLDAD
jgi:CubicO group peptidase (beta-lactamase class C family)